MKGAFNASVFMGRPLYPADITTTVSVYNAETDELVPTLWLNREGVEELSNPHPLSEDGVILFYVDPGRYNIVVEKGTSLYREWPDVIISDSATAGEGGATAFTGLTDAPNSYTGQAGELLRVNSGETALEFAQFGPPLSVDSTSSSYTLSLVIWNQIKNITGSGTVNITIPLDSTLNLPVGYTHIVRPRDAFSGTCTWVKADVSMTLEPPAGGTLVLPAGATSAVTKIAANTWIVYGVTEAV